MVYFKVSDNVTVLDDSRVPLEWRGVNAVVSGVDHVCQDDGSYEIVVTVEDQQEKRLDTQSCLIKLISR